MMFEIQQKIVKTIFKLAVFGSFFLTSLWLTSCYSNTKEKKVAQDSIFDLSTVKDTTSIKKKLIGSVVLGGNGAPKLPKRDYNNLNYDSIFSEVEVIPEPPGGMKAFREWMTNNYILPQDVSKSQKIGKVLLSFIVEKNGSLTNLEVETIKGYGGSIRDSVANRAIDLLKKSKKWTPGIMNGRPVRTRYVLPIRIDPNKMTTPIYNNVR